MAAKKKKAPAPKAPRAPRQNYTVNVFGARPHRIDGTPTPTETQMVRSSRLAQRLMRVLSAKLGIGAYGEIRLPDDGDRLYAQGEIRETNGRTSFVLDREL